MVTTKVLSNGIKVVVKRMEGLLSVTMGILVGTGAAYERDDEDGISHFIEHMQFKGTDTRTAFEISDAFDALGTQVNAFTGKDLTCYYAKATSDHARESFALLADLFLNAAFPEEEMAREKGVVVEEINMDEDSPEDLCLDLLARAAYGNENYGRNILGPAENVERFTREDLFRYKAERYCPENIVVSFAGNLDESLALDLAEEFLGGMKGKAFVNRKKHVLYRHGNLFKKKPIEQAHFALSFPAIERNHPDYAATQVMNVILGGGMSSRLFKRVREELGLAYSVYSYLTHYEEAGSLSVYAGVGANKAEDAVAAVVDVLNKFQKEGVSEEEFKRGREQLKSSTIFSQENTSSQMLLYGKNMLYTGKVYDFEARMAEIAELKLSDIIRVIGNNFDYSRVAVSSVGNLKKPVEITSL